MVHWGAVEPKTNKQTVQYVTAEGRLVTQVTVSWITVVVLRAVTVLTSPNDRESANSKLSSIQWYINRIFLFDLRLIYDSQYIPSIGRIIINNESKMMLKEVSIT